MPMSPPAARAAFDLGGTFTDIVSITPGGELRATKVLSLPDRVGRDVRLLLPEGIGG
jgi:N-methylhydantoinase A/oxoprolinase/acetone carboxylase beta subunit